jgi:4-hydroxybenzoate polyprenyltransferase
MVMRIAYLLLLVSIELRAFDLPAARSFNRLGNTNFRPEICSKLFRQNSAASSHGGMHRNSKQSFRLHSQNAVSNNNAIPNSYNTSMIKDYISLMRPITIIQAVCAYVVGLLVILRHNRVFSLSEIQINVLLSSLSIYLSYGAGMAMNDCADASLDKVNEVKCDRSIASGRISERDGWIFCGMLAILSMTLARISTDGISFVAWNGLNLLLMAGYALGLQKILLIKNFICGWLAISPLIGASIVSRIVLDHSAINKLYKLAAIGFPLQVAREILKDIQDVDSDGGTKQTLPIYIGEANSKRIAYGKLH